MEPKRRLPLIQPSRGASSGSGSGNDLGEDDESRGPWHWVAFGTVATFAVWLPLAYAAQALEATVVARIAGAPRTRDEAAAAAASLPGAVRTKLVALALAAAAVPLVLAAAAGGYLVGRWGKDVGAREASFAGMAVALLASGLAWFSAGFSLEIPLASLAVAVPCAAIGGHLGTRARRRRDAEAPTRT